jgi:hypothetical protein
MLREQNLSWCALSSIVSQWCRIELFGCMFLVYIFKSTMITVNVLITHVILRNGEWRSSVLLLFMLTCPIKLDSTPAGEEVLWHHQQSEEHNSSGNTFFRDIDFCSILLHKLWSASLANTHTTIRLRIMYILITFRIQHRDNMSFLTKKAVS